MMRTENTEVMAKYALVRHQTPLVVMGLLQTLDIDQLYTLLLETTSGAELLLEMVKPSLEGYFDDVLASDQVYIIAEKRWDGAFIRKFYHRNKGNGRQINFMNSCILALMWVVAAVPLNLLWSPFCVLLPPVRRKLKAFFSDKKHNHKAMSWPQKMFDIELKPKAFYLLHWRPLGAV